MKIEIWSDIMCPFCYIGKRHFEIAKAQMTFTNEIEVVWKSFQLDPSLPNEASGESVMDYLSKRKGMSKEQIHSMLDQITQRGKAVGITFNQEKSLPVNTLQAHRMIHFAQERNLGSQMEEALFKAYFTESKDIGNHIVLADLAVALGLDRNEVQEYLSSDAGIEAVRADIAEAQRMRVAGVPFFFVDKTYAISGAQPVSTIAQILRQAYSENDTKNLNDKNDENSTESCTTDNCDM